MFVASGILNNVNQSKLLAFLKDKGCEYNRDEFGMDINIWLGNIIDENRITLEQINMFLFNELFYGMHRDINIYKIKGVKRLQNVELWIDNLFIQYKILDLPYNQIVQTNVNPAEANKIAAISYSENEQGDIEKIQILFIRNIKVLTSQGTTDSYAYIPVEVDMQQRIMIVKGRPRTHVIPGYRTYELQESIFNDISRVIGIEIINFGVKHEEALYRMSKGILEELLEHIEGYNDLSKVERHIDELITGIIENVTLKNVEVIEGKKQINCGGIDIKDELFKMLQSLTISDYLFNKDEDNIWDTGISTIITCIRFNDSKNATARLSSENRRKHIFNSKAFMDLRNSLEIVKNVQSLSIVSKKSRGALKVKYTADNEEYLKILILTYPYYVEEDFRIIWEMYDRYERGDIEKAATVCTTEVG